MKKILIIISAFCILTLPCFADDGDGGGVEDTMKYTNSVENAFLGQEKITDEQFQKTLKEVKAKQQKKKRKNKQQLKGKNFNEETSGGYIGETADKNILLMLPICLVNEDGTDIPIGHYKVVGKKVNDQIFLEFQQSGSTVGKIKATETNNDFDEAGINFIKVLPYNEKRVRIIFGSLDFNAYAYVKIKDEISDQN